MNEAQTTEFLRTLDSLRGNVEFLGWSLLGLIAITALIWLRLGNFNRIR